MRCGSGSGSVRMVSLVNSQPLCKRGHFPGQVRVALGCWRTDCYDTRPHSRLGLRTTCQPAGSRGLRASSRPSHRSIRQIQQAGRPREWRRLESKVTRSVSSEGFEGEAGFRCPKDASFTTGRARSRRDAAFGPCSPRKRAKRVELRTCVTSTIASAYPPPVVRYPLWYIRRL
jgi:hypothetical protein